MNWRGEFSDDYWREHWEELPAREGRDEVRRQHVLAEIRRWHRLFGCPPGARMWNLSALRKSGREDLVQRHRDHGPWPSFSTAQVAFGSFASAIEAAGFQRPVRGTDYGERKHKCPPLMERLLQRVEYGPNGCWLWTGNTASGGYGHFGVDGRTQMAHRLMYELVVGPIPGGLTIDHLCRTPACINPSHLEPVTQRENTLRGIGPSARNAVKTHCLRGHPLSGENLRIRPDGNRECKECKRMLTRKYRAQRTAERDEAASRAALYGERTRTGNVAPACGRKKSCSFQHCHINEENA